MCLLPVGHVLSVPDGLLQKYPATSQHRGNGDDDDDTNKLAHTHLSIDFTIFFTTHSLIKYHARPLPSHISYQAAGNRFANGNASK